MHRLGGGSDFLGGDFLGGNFLVATSLVAIRAVKDFPAAIFSAVTCLPRKDSDNSGDRNRNHHNHHGGAAPGRLSADPGSSEAHEQPCPQAE